MAESVKKKMKQNEEKQLFEMYMHLIVKEEAADLINLLRKDVDWKLDQQFIDTMHVDMVRLLDKWIQKSSYFGKYRILSMTDDPEQKLSSSKGKNKPQINVKESDFHFGWKAIKTDVMSE